MRYYFSPVYILSRLEVLHLPIMSRTYFPPCPQMWQCERSSIPLARLCVRARACVCVCVRCSILFWGKVTASLSDYITARMEILSRMLSCVEAGGSPFLESTNNFLQRGILQLVEPPGLTTAHTQTVA